MAEFHLILSEQEKAYLERILKSALGETRVGHTARILPIIGSRFSAKSNWFGNSWPKSRNRPPNDPSVRPVTHPGDRKSVV